VIPFSHQPVMVKEVLEALQPAPGQLFLDGTLGGGGHSARILDATSPDGKVIGLDRDAQAVEAAGQKLSRYGSRLQIHHANFSEMARFASPESCNGVLLDLGVSSPQIDLAERGFSFQQAGPLDMRMDRREPVTAADIVNTWPNEELANLFWELGGERESRRLARAIEKRRKVQAFTTTEDLAGFISSQMPRGKQRIHPATRVFQALRIEVNHELEALETGLNAAWRVLKSGGRFAVITFHSLEDRMVKNFGRSKERNYTVKGEVDLPEFRTPREPEGRWISRKAILPSEEEIRGNPRARSAQLRVLEKL
jgi:16S rRNA (cytosine1402-N4)-methyltransferase